MKKRVYFRVTKIPAFNVSLFKFNFDLMIQVLLSQVHRLRALELLGKFLDLGPWAVNLALSVGIFPYVLKLLQSSARELRPLLVFIWAKILAVDSVSSCFSGILLTRQ
jgi:regulator-associated protein of mTOR